MPTPLSPMSASSANQAAFQANIAAMAAARRRQEEEQEQKEQQERAAAVRHDKGMPPSAFSSYYADCPSFAHDLAGYKECARVVDLHRLQSP